MGGKSLSPMDAMFIYGESQQTMMHVAGMLPFSPPPDAPPDFVGQLMQDIRAAVAVQRPWNQRLKTPGFKLNPRHQWIEDDHFDLDYHLRHSALPVPGDERQLGVLISRLHSHQIDFTRPPWELHVIEGLEGGRFALYSKIHHALVDGYTAMRILQRSLSPDPDDRDTVPYFALPPPQRAPREAVQGVDMSTVWHAVSSQFDSAMDVSRALWRLLRHRSNELGELVSSMQAPECILNRKIGRNRRFATQQYEIADLQALAKAAGGTLNDIVMALSAGGLRKYLLEQDALPDKPLIAFLPVNVRPKDDPGGGNAVGAMLASLATHVEDPLKRLEAIIASTRSAKAQMESMSAAGIIAYSTLIMAPFMLQTLQAVTGVRSRLPLNFNLCISNVPGPKEPLYFRGARLEATYPVSIPAHGMGLNITVQSYAGTLNFGFVGCRDTVPSLQRLAVYTGETFDELKQLLL